MYSPRATRSTHENAILKFYASDFDGLEEFRERLSIGLWLICRSCGRYLCSSEVGNTLRRCVEDVSRHDGGGLFGEERGVYGCGRGLG